MKKLTLIFALAFFIANCSDSSDQNDQNKQEVDVSEGQTNWTKYAYYDTLTYALDASTSPGEVGVLGIAIRGQNVLLAGYEADFEPKGIIWGSKDGGKTWHSKKGLSCGAGSIFTDITFASGKVAYAIGECHGTTSIFKSVDGGETWDHKAALNYGVTVPQKTTSPMFFFNQNLGIVGNLKTLDGGTTWNIMEDLKDYPNFNENNSAIISNHFINDLIGYCNSQRNIFKTKDGGENWTQVYEDTVRVFRRVYFLGETTGFLITDTDLLKTIDGGASWETALDAEVKDISFPSLDVGFIAAPEGIYKTSDMGESWQLNYSSQFYFFRFEVNGSLRNGPMAPTSIEFEDENIGIIGGLQYNLLELPNGKAYIARTATLGE